MCRRKEMYASADITIYPKGNRHTKQKIFISVAGAHRCSLGPSLLFLDRFRSKRPRRPTNRAYPLWI